MREIDLRRGLLAVLKRWLPANLLEALRLSRPKTWRDARHIAPARDYVRLLRLIDARTEAPGVPVSLRVDFLGRATVALRPGTTDVTVLLDTMQGYHLPPDDLVPDVIVDLGCNVGLTTAHFATLYEHAEILGVEPEPSAAALATRNVSPWARRCRILNVAAWHEDTKLRFIAEAGHEYGARLSPNGAIEVTALSLNTLLASHDVVDFLKMDIEGAESDVLTRHTRWASKVRCLKVETHPPYEPDRCATELGHLGFRTSRDGRHNLAVIARRP
jgi:FkbM family methyltransferase